MNNYKIKFEKILQFFCSNPSEKRHDINFLEIEEILNNDNPKQNIMYKITEQLHYLNYMYKDIYIKNDEIKLNDFICSSIIFWELSNIIEIFFKEIDSKISMDKIFEEIVLNSFIFTKTNNKIDKIFFDNIGGNLLNKARKQKISSFQVLKTLRNKLIHPNGKLYGVTHILGAGNNNLGILWNLPNKNISNTFSFRSSYEEKKYNCESFLVKKDIFLKAIKEIYLFLLKDNIFKNASINFIRNERKKLPDFKLTKFNDISSKDFIIYDIDNYFKLLFKWAKQNNDKEAKKIIKIVFNMYKKKNLWKNSKYEFDFKIINNTFKISRILIEKYWGKNINMNYAMEKSNNWTINEWFEWHEKLNPIAKKEFLKLYKKNKINNFKPKKVIEMLEIISFSEIDFKKEVIELRASHNYFIKSKNKIKFWELVDIFSY